MRSSLDPDGSVPLERITAATWALHIETYLRLLETGVPFLAIRYDEIQSEPEATAARLLQHCGLPAEASAAAVRALGRDSQAGTAIARDRRDAPPFTEAAAAEFRAALARQGRILSADLVLPDVHGPAAAR